MKYSLKRVSTLLVAAALVFSFAGCGKTQTQPTQPTQTSQPSPSQSPSVKQPIVLTAFAMEGPYTKGNFSDLPIWKITEKATGIKINFETAPQASFTEKLNLKLASNQLPDLFFKSPMTNADITKYASQGVLVPIDGYLKQYAPNFSKYMANDPSIEKNIRMSDKKIYGFPYLVTAMPSRINPKMFVNKKWMDSEKLSMPTTTEEFYNLLVKFRDSDFNKNGKQDEIPLCIESTSYIYYSLMGSFGLMTRGAAQNSWDIDPKTNELRYIKTSDQYKEFLQYYNRLYSQKLLDQEVFTNDIKKVTAKAQQNIIGVAFVTNSNYLGDYKDDFTNLTEALTGPHGDKLYAGRTIPVAGQNTFITKVNKYPADTVRWVDYLYSPEGIESYFMGVKGETYEIAADGTPKFTKLVTNNPEGLNMEEVLGRYICWSGGGNPSVADDLHFGNHLIPPITVASAKALMPSTPKEIWGSFVYSEADNKRLTVLQTDIDTYVTDMAAKFITGQASFDNWDTYKKDVDKMGLAEYKQITQRALDTYNGK